MLKRSQITDKTQTNGWIYKRSWQNNLKAVTDVNSTNPEVLWEALQSELDSKEEVVKDNKDKTTQRRMI